MVPADTARTIKEEYNILLKELNEYNPELMHKPRVLAITKSDMLDDELQQEMEKEVPADIPYVFISSVAQKNITELKDLLWKEINK
jgi:GTP-binding protein